jgi:hypothetical protein
LNNVNIDESNADYDKVKAIAITILDYFDQMKTFVSYSSKTLPDSLTEMVPWDRYFVNTFRSSPILCRIYLEFSEVYGVELRQIASPACAAPVAR